MGDTSNSAYSAVRSSGARKPGDVPGVGGEEEGRGGLRLGSMSLWRALLDGQPASQFLIEIVTGRILHANPAAAALHDRSVSALCNSTLYDLLETPDIAMGDVVDELLDGQRFYIRISRGLASGRRRMVAIEATPVELDRSGPALHIIERGASAHLRAGGAPGPHEQRRDDAALAFYRLKSVPQERFVAIDRALMRLFEAPSPNKLYEMGLSGLHVDARERDRFLETLADRGEVFRYESRLRTLGGREIRIANTARRYLEEDGKPTIDGVIEDISQQCPD